MTIKLRSNFFGLVKPLYARWAFIMFTNFLASHGNIANKTNAKIISGVKIPSIDWISASCVPTFTNMIDPEIIPKKLVIKNTAVRIGVNPINKLITKNGKIGINRSVNK